MIAALLTALIMLAFVSGCRRRQIPAPVVIVPTEQTAEPSGPSGADETPVPGETVHPETPGPSSFVPSTEPIGTQTPSPEPSAAPSAAPTASPTVSPSPTPKPTPTPSAAPAETEAGFEKNVKYSSRGVKVPATIRMPERHAGEKVPLVVLAHGHGGSRNQGGGFAYIAEALANNGIASIRMDFPGCGSSAESFRENNLTNMKQDVLAAVSFMQNNYGTDPARVGLIGYSMGGRISLELVADGSVRPYAMLLIAPAASTKDLKRLFGGEEAWERMKAEAQQHGYAVFGSGSYEQELGLEFFLAIERIENPSAQAAANFHGRSTVFYSLNDGAVLPAVSKGVAEALGSSTVVFESGGHGYGLSGPPTGALLSVVISKAVDLFKT